MPPSSESRRVCEDRACDSHYFMTDKHESSPVEMSGSSEKESSEGDGEDVEAVLDCFKGNKWLSMNTDSASASEKAKRQSFAFLLEWVQTEASDILGDKMEATEAPTFLNMQSLMSKMFEDFRSKTRRVKQLESRLRDRDAHIEMLEAVVNELQKQFVVQVESAERAGTPLKNTASTGAGGEGMGTGKATAAEASAYVTEVAGSEKEKRNSIRRGSAQESVPGVLASEEADDEAPWVESGAVQRDESPAPAPAPASAPAPVAAAGAPVEEPTTTTKKAAASTGVSSAVPMSDTRKKAHKSLARPDSTEDVIGIAGGNDNDVSSLSSDDSFDPLVA